MVSDGEWAIKAFLLIADILQTQMFDQLQLQQ